MSKSQSQNTVTVECTNPTCTVHGNHWEFRDGEYCSTECETKHNGWKALNDLRKDHTRCFTCFTQLKDIEPPKPEWAFDVTGTGWTLNREEDRWELEYYSQEITEECAQGFQYRTPEAGIGEKEGQYIVTTGTVCDECGNCAHQFHIPYLVDDHVAAGRVVSLLGNDEDAPPFSIHQFHREYVDTQDLFLALGRAIDDA